MQCLCKAFPFFFHQITQFVSNCHGWHASLVSDLLSLRFSVQLTKQTAVFLLCIYKFNVPVKAEKQQQAGLHSEQYSLQMRNRLFWYSN